MALSTTIDLKIAANLTKTTDLVAAGASIPLLASLNATLTSGTTAGKADTVFSDTRNLGSGATEDLDLAGALVNALGDAAIFVKVKLLWIKSAAANTVNLTLFGDAASALFVNTAATTVTLDPGGVFMLYRPTGVTVTGTTADILQVAAGAASSDYDILIVGTSA